MSEETGVSPAEMGEILENGTKDCKLVLHSEKSIEKVNVSAEQLRIPENRPIESSPTEEQNRQVLGSVDSGIKAEDSIPPEKQPGSSEAFIAGKLLEKSGDVDLSAEEPVSDAEIKSLDTASDGNQPAEEPSSDAVTGIKSLGTASDGNQPAAEPTSDAVAKIKSLDMASNGDQPAEEPASSDAVAEIKSLDRGSEGNQPSAESTTNGKLADSNFSKRSGDAQPSVSSAASGKLAESPFLERSNDVEQSVAKSVDTVTSDKGLETVTENIQKIYEGLKVMKISGEETVASSGKKGPKPSSIPRARGTPVKPLTSPPLTRSRSRDLRKFPSTPASPSRVANSKDESELDVLKKARGRQRVKKN